MKKDQIPYSTPLSIRILLLAGTLIIGIMLGIMQLRPPRLDDASPLYPTYQQMMANIERFATEPHPNGSPENDRVREAIVAEIKSMGLTPVTEREEYSQADLKAQVLERDGLSSEEWWELNKEIAYEMYGAESLDEALTAKIAQDGPTVMQNILVKLDAPDTDRGMLLVSHYDSTSGGPGAADDMVSVAAMLEAMRKQAGNPALKNDLYFLFTDGEEIGLMGAWKFVRSHTGLEEQIDMTINLEARGNRGALLLFETSAQAYDLMKTTIRSGIKPIAFSWATTIYSMMPNGTDFSNFKQNGYQGINFAAIEGVENYHMPTDSYENLNRDTAWHYLNTVIGLTNYGASEELSELHDPSSEAVYFSFFPGNLVLLNYFVSGLFCIVIILLTLAGAGFRIRHKDFKLSFAVIIMAVLVLLSIISSIGLPTVSYLFYLPLLLMTISSFLRKKTIAHLAVKAVSGMIILLLWVPVVFTLWVCLVQPMLL